MVAQFRSLQLSCLSSIAALLLVALLPACGAGASAGLEADAAAGNGGSVSTGGGSPSGGTGGSGASTGSGGSGASTGSGGSGAVTGGGGGGGTGPGGLRWIGRVNATNPNAATFAWSGSGLVATVTGTKISVKLQMQGSASFFQPVIDGKAGTRFQVQSGATQTVVLGTGLTSGSHTVELYRETEGMYGYSVFMGFVDGTVTGAPAPTGRLIEVVGDSISAGYGNLGVEVHPPWDNACGFTLDTESAYQSYGAQVARLLKAEVSIIARSGWGMSRDLGGSTTGVVPSVYGNAVGTGDKTAWDFKQKAAAVIINLGTNDAGANNGSDPGTAFETAYEAFIKTVRSKYPDAWILMTIGTMTGDPLLTTMRNHLANIKAAVNDPKVFTVNMDTQDATSTGCDYHPNVAEDTKMAQVLAPALKAKLGW